MRYSNLSALGVVVILLVAANLSACASIASAVTSVAGTLAGPVPNQAATLADAIQIADLATKTTKLAVDTVKLPTATLVQLSALNDGVHTALTDLEAANAAGQSLDFAAFNAAIGAYNAYAVTAGVGKIN